MLSLTTPNLWPILSRKQLDQLNVNSEKLKLKLKVYFPWDNEYNSKRTYFSIRIQQRPLFIVFPESNQQLEYILNYITRKKLTVRFMNGRHSTQLSSSQVLIDTTYFNQVKIKENYIKVGGGCTQGKVNEILFNHHIKNIHSHFGHFCHPKNHLRDLFPGGSAASVGISGISTAGGIGILIRTYGPTIDSIISFTITIPPSLNESSKTIIVDENNYQDLFWALRGGGAADFGIISNINYKILYVPRIIEYEMTFDWDKAIEALDKWQLTSIHRPNNFNEDITINKINNVNTISLGGHYVMLDNEIYEDAILKIKNQLKILGGSLIINKSISYQRLYRKLVVDRSYFNFSIIQAFFTNIIDSKRIINFFNNNSLIKCGISFQLLGGVMKNVLSSECAFYPRNYNFFVDIYVQWNNEIDSQESNHWCNQITNHFLNNKRNIMYVGFPLTFTDTGSHNSTLYFGKNNEKLKLIKEKYDPLHVLNQCGIISKN